ncbi:MAG: hypothetical protein ACRCWI_03510 [Brevinema sp.]
MFIKIFSLPLTMYIFAIGFTLNFLIVAFRGFPFFNMIWVACIGGFVFCGIWAGLLKLLSLLLEEKELAAYFSIVSEDKFYDLEDEDELTIDDLYSTTDDTIDDSFPNPYQQEESSDISSHDYIENEFSKTFDQDVSLDSTGEFHLTVNGKTLKASPKDGAKAIKKVLHDDR